MKMSKYLENVYDQQKYGLPSNLWPEFRALAMSTVKSMKWYAVKGAHYVRIYCEFTIKGMPAGCYSSIIGAECKGLPWEMMLYRMVVDVLRLLRVQSGLDRLGRLEVDRPESVCNITILKPA